MEKAQRGNKRNTWWDYVREDMKSLSLTKEDVVSANKW